MPGGVPLVPHRRLARPARAHLRGPLRDGDRYSRVCQGTDQGRPACPGSGPQLRTRALPLAPGNPGRPPDHRPPRRPGNHHSGRGDGRPRPEVPRPPRMAHRVDLRPRRRDEADAFADQFARGRCQRGAGEALLSEHEHRRARPLQGPPSSGHLLVLCRRHEHVGPHQPDGQSYGSKGEAGRAVLDDQPGQPSRRMDRPVRPRFLVPRPHQRHRRCRPTRRRFGPGEAHRALGQHSVGARHKPRRHLLHPGSLHRRGRVGSRHRGFSRPGLDALGRRRRTLGERARATGRTGHASLGSPSGCPCDQRQFALGHGARAECQDRCVAGHAECNAAEGEWRRGCRRFGDEVVHARLRHRPFRSAARNQRMGRGHESWRPRPLDQRPPPSAEFLRGIDQRRHAPVQVAVAPCRRRLEGAFPQHAQLRPGACVRTFERPGLDRRRDSRGRLDRRRQL